MKDLFRKTLAPLILFYASLVFLLTAYFVFSRQLALPVALSMLLAALVLGALFGVMVAALDRLQQSATALLRRVLPGVTAGFLLFFGYVIGYILLFTGLVAYPQGRIIDAGVVNSTAQLDFKLYSMNFVLFLAVWSWLDHGGRLVRKMARWLQHSRARAGGQETP